MIVEYLFLNEDEQALVHYMEVCQLRGVAPTSADLAIPTDRIKAAARVLEAVGVLRKLS